jgi:protein SCO1/2
MTDNMKILQDKFIDDSEILLLSHSVTPKNCCFERICQRKWMYSGKWHLLTGDKEAFIQ